MRELKKVPEAEANTWVATQYWTQYGTKIGVTDDYYDEPIHMVLCSLFVRTLQPVVLKVEECNVGGATLHEYRQDGSLYCERRVYLVVKGAK